MVLSGAECFIAVLAAFYSGRSCTVLALSFRGTMGAEHKIVLDHILRPFWTSIVRPRQYLSSAQALGLNIKWAGVTNSLTPQYPIKILLSDLLVGEEGFGDAKPLSQFA